MDSGESAHRANIEGAQRAIASKQESQLAVLREIRALLAEQTDLLREMVKYMEGQYLSDG